MIRIVYVSHSFPPPDAPLSNVGGMQRVATGLHDALAVHPEVDLVPFVLETTWKATPYRTPAFLARVLATLPRVVEAERADAVLFSSMVTASVAPVVGDAVRRRGAVLAAIPVGRDVTLPTPGYGRWVRRTLGALDLAFPISRATAEECALRGMPAGRMQVIPCGVDLRAFAPPADRAAARAALLERAGFAPGEVGDGEMLLASVGRHQRRKGFQWFADTVLPRLRDGVRWVLPGEGPMTGEIEEAVRRHGLESRVRLLGPVDEATLRAIYQGADLFVMPNIHVPGDIEGFGVVMLEAGMCGCPVIAADLEGIRDVIRDGENGHLLPAEDADAFAAAVARWRDDRGGLAAFSARASEHTAGHFGWPAVADRYVRALESLAGERRVTGAPSPAGSRSPRPRTRPTSSSVPAASPRGASPAAASPRRTPDSA